MLWTNSYYPSTLWTNYLNEVYNDSGDDDNNWLRIWVLHHLVLTVCSLFVQHKLSSQKGRRHLERFSRKYIELCPIIVTEQRCRTPDLVSEKVWLCLTKVSPTTIFLGNFWTTSAKFTTKGLLKVKCFKTDISRWSRLFTTIYEMSICKFATC